MFYLQWHVLCALEAIKKLSAEVESLLMNLAELRKGRRIESSEWLGIEPL